MWMWFVWTATFPGTTTQGTWKWSHCSSQPSLRTGTKPTKNPLSRVNMEQTQCLGCTVWVWWCSPRGNSSSRAAKCNGRGWHHWAWLGCERLQLGVSKRLQDCDPAPPKSELCQFVCLNLSFGSGRKCLNQSKPWRMEVPGAVPCRGGVALLSICDKDHVEFRVWWWSQEQHNEKTRQAQSFCWEWFLRQWGWLSWGCLCPHPCCCGCRIRPWCSVRNISRPCSGGTTLCLTRRGRSMWLGSSSGILLISWPIKVSFYWYSKHLSILPVRWLMPHNYCAGG